MKIVAKGADGGGVLGDREAEVMAVLWATGAGTVAQVRSDLTAELAYTTVLTILRNLERKGFVSHETVGRAHRYSPQVGRREATQGVVHRLLGAYFGGSAEKMVRYLAKVGMIGRKDLKRIRRDLDRDEPGQTPGRSKKRQKRKRDRKAGKHAAPPSSGVVDGDGGGVEFPPDASARKVMGAVVLDRENAGEAPVLPDLDETVQHS